MKIEKRWKKVTEYSVYWNVKQSKGLVKVILEDGVNYTVEVNTPRELNIIENILRNEESVNYNLITGSIASGWQLI